MFGSPPRAQPALDPPSVVIHWFTPLAVYPTPLRLGEEISARPFAALTALVWIGRFGCSLETLATITLFGAVALALTWRIGYADLRRLNWGTLDQSILPPDFDRAGLAKPPRKPDAAPDQDHVCQRG